MSTLEFDSIVLNFGERTILSNVSARISVGEVIGLLGRNGSGKSSLMQAVFGSLTPSYKSVRIDGQPLPKDHFKHRLIAYLPQAGLVPSHLRISDAITMLGVDVSEIIGIFPECEPVLKLLPPHLSGGMRKMIETLMLLKSRASFCLLDEPFNGVAPVYVELLHDLIRRNKHQKGILITDHRYSEVLAVADRVYVLTNGQTYVVKDEHDLVRRGYISG